MFTNNKKNLFRNGPGSIGESARVIANDFNVLIKSGLYDSDSSREDMFEIIFSNRVLLNQMFPEKGDLTRKLSFTQMRSAVSNDGSLSRSIPIFILQLLYCSSGDFRRNITEVSDSNLILILEVLFEEVQSTVPERNNLTKHEFVKIADRLLCSWYGNDTYNKMVQSAIINQITASKDISESQLESIITNRSICNIKRGDSEESVNEKIGRPDKRESYMDGDTKEFSSRLYYYSYGLKIEVSESKGSVTMIIIYSGLEYGDKSLHPDGFTESNSPIDFKIANKEYNITKDDIEKKFGKPIDVYKRNGFKPYTIYRYKAFSIGITDDSGEVAYLLI